MLNKPSIYLITILFLVWHPCFVLAETIVLKSGQRVTGKILEKTNKYMKADVDGTSLTFYTDEIKGIEQDQPSPDKVVETAQVLNSQENTPQQEAPDNNGPGADQPSLENVAQTATVAAPQDDAPMPKDPDIYGLDQLEDLKKWAIQNSNYLYFVLTQKPFNFQEYANPIKEPGVIINIDVAANNNVSTYPAIIQSAMRNDSALGLPITYVIDPQMTRVIKRMIIMRKPFDIPLDGSSISGNENAPLSLVMFCDFQCPYCAQYYPNIKNVLKTYPDLVRLIIKHFPLPFHPNALSAAKAVLAAGEQGKSFEMGELLFADQSNLNDQTYQQLAQKLGIDSDKFSNDLKENDSAYQAKIDRDIQLGTAIQIHGTPSFYMNGYLVHEGDMNYWKMQMDDILDKNK